jgi:hypothetical protein
LPIISQVFWVALMFSRQRIGFTSAHTSQMVKSTVTHRARMLRAISRPLVENLEC